MKLSISNLAHWWNRPHDTHSGDEASHAPAPRAGPSPSPGVPTMDADAARRRLGAPVTLRYPETTLGDLLDQSAARFPDNPALIYGKLLWDYRHLREQSNRLAAGFALLGVRRGDRVLIALPNCPEAVVAFFAVQKLAATVVNAGPLVGADDLRRMIALSAPRLVVGLDLLAPMFWPTLGEGKQTACLWVSLKGYQTLWRRWGYDFKLWKDRPSSAVDIDAQAWTRIMDSAPARPPTLPAGLDDIAVLQPTSGTTGGFKLASLSHRNIVTNAVQIASWGRFSQGQGSILGLLPMFHAYGLTAGVILPIYNASTILPLTRFRVSQTIEVIRQHRPLYLPLVPMVIDAICAELEHRPNPDLVDALRGAMVTSGAAALPPATSRRYEKLVGARIAQGYGLTEASPVTHGNHPSEPHEDSVGLPLPDTLVRIVDLAEPTRDAAVGEAGELWISGPQIFHGYLDDPDATARALSVDARGRRWLHTGDVAKIGADGHLQLVDRLRDMINHNGLKVWPGKIEQLIQRHSHVLDVAVIARPDPVHTQNVCALVKAQPGTDLAALQKEILAVCREHLAPYEVPQIVEFVEELPRTPLGKLQKHKLGDPLPITPDATQVASQAVTDVATQAASKPVAAEVPAAAASVEASAQAAAPASAQTLDAGHEVASAPVTASEQPAHASHAPSLKEGVL